MYIGGIRKRVVLCCFAFSTYTSFLMLVKVKVLVA